MISKEQIAHDLSIAYINNRYGVNVTGEFYFTGNDNTYSNTGTVITERFPNVDEIKKVKVGTGEKGFLGFEKKKWNESGFLVDEVFTNRPVPKPCIDSKYQLN